MDAGESTVSAQDQRQAGSLTELQLMAELDKAVASLEPQRREALMHTLAAGGPEHQHTGGVVMADQQRNVRLKIELAEQLKKASVFTGKSIQDMVTLAVEQALPAMLKQAGVSDAVAKAILTDSSSGKSKRAKAVDPMRYVPGQSSTRRRGVKQ